MRRSALLLPLALVLAACSMAHDDDPSRPSDGDALTESSAPACSPAYWSWVLHDLEPQLARPIGELSPEQLSRLVAARPPSEDTSATYAVCWKPLFDRHFVAPALARLHGATTAFVGASADERTLPRYVESVTMPPELRRNATALLALKPRTMGPSDTHEWMFARDSVLAEVIHPVGVPGRDGYEANTVVEDEWVIDDAEAEYVDIVERAQSAPARDGAYGEWIVGAGRWLFGPPPAGSQSFVFNLPWESAGSGADYGLRGVDVTHGRAELPPRVRAFVDGLARTRPAALGSNDSAAWFGLYAARALRALSDRAGREAMAADADGLALALLEEVRPQTLRGAAAFDTWLDVVVAAAQQGDKASLQRFTALEPCVDAPELASAEREFGDRTSELGASLQKPRVCP